VNFAAITLCIASQQVFIVVVYFVIDSVLKILDILSYVGKVVPILHKASRHADVLGRGGIAPRILDHGTRRE
jgi:hypothetical protein